MKLFHNREGFHVFKDEKTYQVKNHLLDRDLHNISKDDAKLKEFLKNGYIAVNQAENGEYLLEARDRLQGGGPILGKAFYFITKAVGHIVGVPEEITEVAAQSAETMGNVIPGP